MLSNLLVSNRILRYRGIGEYRDDGIVDGLTSTLPHVLIYTCSKSLPLWYSNIHLFCVYKETADYYNAYYLGSSGCYDKTSTDWVA